MTGSLFQGQARSHLSPLPSPALPSPHHPHPFQKVTPGWFSPNLPATAAWLHLTSRPVATPPLPAATPPLPAAGPGA